MQALPPLTPSLITAAKAYPRLLDWHALDLSQYRDAWDPKALLGDTAVHILSRALDERIETKTKQRKS